MFMIIRVLTLDHKIVILKGGEGTGKTAIAWAIADYLSFRDYYKVLMYIRLQGLFTIHQLVLRIYTELVSALNEEYKTASLEDQMREISKMIEDHWALIILDGQIDMPGD